MLCLHNPETLMTNQNLHKNTALTVSEQITPSQLVSRNLAMIKINEKHMFDQNPLQSHLSSTFVLLPLTEQDGIIVDIEVEVLHVTLIKTKTTPHKIDNVLQPEIALHTTKIPLPTLYSFMI